MFDKRFAFSTLHYLPDVTPDPRAPDPRVIDLGRRAYEPVHTTMLQTLEDVRQGRSPGEILLVEHDPVYTAGRATPKEELGDGVVPIERGGKITYHGPGQLVVYPIVRLPSKDVRAWLHAIEAFGVAICAHFGLATTPSVDGTGVFVEDRKIASIGVTIRHWINLHGISINVAMDLQAFHAIRPCGLDPSVMTDLCRETGREIDLNDARAAVTACLPTLLGSDYASAE